MEVIKPNINSFDFKRITLANPEPLQNSNYFTRITLENNKPLCIQMPKCTTKQGIVDVKGIKYCDLMYERSEHEDLKNWIEQLEYACQDKLNEKKELWFQTELSRDDIESMMSPLMRVYQSGKYILIRNSLNTQKTNGLDKSIAYNEQEANIDLDKLVSTDSIVPLIIISGIKFSSRSFEIEIKLSQMMIFDKTIEYPCLIKNVGKEVVDKTPIVSIKEAPIVSIKEAPIAIKEAPIAIKEAPIAIKEAPIVYVKQLKEAQFKETPIQQAKTTLSDDPLSLEEISLNYENVSETIILKKPNEVYYEIYKVARTKAKHLRQVAMEAYLEAKEIKTKYMLTDLDDSSSEEEEEEED